MKKQKMQSEWAPLMSPFGCKCKGRHVNFARAPLRLYFDGPQKKLLLLLLFIYLFTAFTIVLRIIFEFLVQSLQTMRECY